MNVLNFIKKAVNKDYNENVLQRIENSNSPILQDEARHMFSSVQERTPIFFDDENFFRLLSLQEILDDSKDMNVDFKSIKIIPLIDCGDNDYIAFDSNDNTWCKFNIAEEFKYSKRNSIQDYFNN